MATYKAEFSAHHYRGRLRPRAAYAMGRIADWARVASLAPAAANALIAAPGLGRVVKWTGGIAPSRTMPAFAHESFTAWHRQRRSGRTNGTRILLWPDTFTNHFRPQAAIAATRVLESLGYVVAIPDRPLCCGRPLYEWGWLGKAKRLWNRTLTQLKADIEAGTPVIGLEPACTSAFKDELPNLLPDDPLAARLSAQTHYFANFLQDHSDRLAIERSAGEKALVQIHCHQHALLDAGASGRLLDTLGVEYERLPGGCCGMAGAFGFEAAKVDVSLAIAERALLPRLREAPPDALIVADGFSCREQIEQGTGRKTLHIAEITARRVCGVGALT